MNLSKRMHALEVAGLFKWFVGADKVRAVDHVTLSVETGDMLVLLGPSGCGKTTLLRCIAGLEDAQEGRITFGDRIVFDAAQHLNVPTHRRDIGMVFQNYSLWPHMTVQRNVEYPLRARHARGKERVARVAEVLGVVQCAHLADRLPSMLSGGQQQRIALARALAPSPALMLLDEPLSNLDALLREELRVQLRTIHRELGFTGVYVTHDQTEAFTLGTRVAVMNAGRIEQVGTAAEVNGSPATEYIARFLGIRNALAVTYDGEWTSPAGPLRGDLSPFGQTPRALRLYVRPEDIALVRPGSPGPERSICLGEGRIEDAIAVGHETNYVIAAREALLQARLSGVDAAAWKPDDRVEIHVAHDDLLLYADGRLVPRETLDRNDARAMRRAAADG